MKSLPLAVSLAVLLLGIASGHAAYAEIEYHSEIGGGDIGDDRLNEPTDLDYNGDDRLLYVVDSKNNRINVFENDGEHDFKFGTFCSILEIEHCHDNSRGADEDGDGQFDSPSTATFDEHENLFVVDSENGRVQIFDGGRFEMKFGSADRNDEEYLGLPQGIAILESSDRIFVSSKTSDAIHVFDYAGKSLFKFDSYDTGDSFSEPSHLLIDNAGKILYVSDSGNDQIGIFELVRRNTCPAGTDRVAEGVCFVEKFGESGRGDGQFKSPSGLAFDAANDRLYVADTGNDRIQSFQLVGGDSCPRGTDRVAEGVCFVEKFGESGRGDGQFKSPSGLAFDAENDRLYVADTGNDRIQVLSLNTENATAPSAPENLRASPISPTGLVVSWDAPVQNDRTPKVTGYKIEYRKDSERYTVLDSNTGNTGTSFTHTGLEHNKSYTYRVYEISSDGTGKASIITAKPQKTTTPSGLIAEAIHPHQVRLSWYAPSDTFGQQITGYEIYRVYPNGVTDRVGQTNTKTTTFVVDDLSTNRTYSFAVSATIGTGSSDESDAVTVTTREYSAETASFDNSYGEIATNAPSPPIKLSATRTSPSEVRLSWGHPADDGNSRITGYKIEYKRDSRSYETLIKDTGDTARSYKHANVSANSKYTYQVYAINAAGISSASNQSTALVIPDTLKIKQIGKLTVDEKKTLTFSVMLEDGAPSNVRFSLESNPPAGARINSTTGVFFWTPNDSSGGKSYTFDVVAKKDSMRDRQQVTITVNDTSVQEPLEAEEQHDAEPDDAATVAPDDTATVAPFVDPEIDPQYYINRYINETAYKEWFDTNYSEYASIYEAVGLEEPAEAESAEEHESAEESVAISAEQQIAEGYGKCGEGTELVGDTCEIIETPEGGGCLIATAAYGTETAYQVQFLREIRDDRLMGTSSGTAFMSGFNHLYYLFSPHVADYQRENPAFKEAVRIAITPLLASLEIMSMADSEQEVLGYGILVMMINAVIYLGAPAAATYGIMRLRSKKPVRVAQNHSI